ncbi:MAG: nucleotidyltransferase domain-containing protein [Planctomycetes bacterium]|nr:nucleotidyltransferase domain-containing protein [Planctomycetota bacterium]
MDRPTIVERLKVELASAPPELLAAYLYGSTARDEHTDASDIDLGLLYREEPPRTLDSPPRRLEGRLELALRRTLQVVVMNSAPPDLVHRILRDGILCLDRDRSARIRFEVKAQNEYFDLLPYLRRYRSAGSAGT